MAIERENSGYIYVIGKPTLLLDRRNTIDTRI